MTIPPPRSGGGRGAALAASIASDAFRFLRFASLACEAFRWARERSDRARGHVTRGDTAGRRRCLPPPATPPGGGA